MANIHRFEVYNDKSGRSQSWRWRFRAGNEEPMARGGEGFASKSNAERSIKRFIALVQGDGPPIVETDD